MRHLGTHALLCAVSALVLVPMAQAQDEPRPGEQAAQGQNSQCMQDLQSLAERMQEDGYWLSGYRGYGVSPSAGSGVAPTTPRPEPRPGDLAVTEDGAEPQRPAPDLGAWGPVTWAQPPQYEIGALYEAAFVLARNGKEDLCRTMVEATQERYQGYVAELEEQGIDPSDVTTWRQAQIAAAEPVTAFERRLRVENIVGTNLRNAEDEDLGSIEDVMLDPETGAVQYVVVSRGGVFGLGAEETVVPWDRLRVTPGLNTFVLPVDEETLARAPSVPDEGIFDPEQTGSIDTGDVDAYWDEVPQD